MQFTFIANQIVVRTLDKYRKNGKDILLCLNHAGRFKPYCVLVRVFFPLLDDLIMVERLAKFVDTVELMRNLVWSIGSVRVGRVTARKVAFYYRSSFCSRSRQQAAAGLKGPQNAESKRITAIKTITSVERFS